MYRTFEINNFRCFDHLKLDDLARVNLIGGKNNVGKTALLEALFIHSGIYNPELALRLNAFRGISQMRFTLAQSASTPWEPLFSEFDTNKTVVFTSEGEQHTNRSLSLRVLREAAELKEARLSVQSGNNGSGTAPSTSSEPIQVLRLEYKDQNQSGVSHAVMDREGFHSEVVSPAPYHFVFMAARGRPPLEEEADRFTNLAVSEKRGLLLETLRILEPRLHDVELLTFGGETVLWGRVKTERPKPLIYMGDGLNRLSSLICAIAYSQNGLVLVDEIENGLHYSVLKDVWKAIGRAAREFNTQIFATTHSWECIVAAHQAFSEGEYDFRYHRLDRTKEGGIRAVTYTSEVLQAAIEANFEVR
jgi:hypothetical protein